MCVFSYVLVWRLLGMVDGDGEIDNINFKISSFIVRVGIREGYRGCYWVEWSLERVS